MSLDPTDQAVSGSRVGDLRQLSDFGRDYVLELADWHHDVPRGTSGVVYLPGDGELLETWVTSYRAPYNLASVYERIR